MASVQVIGLLILVLVQWFLLAVLLQRNQTSESHGRSSSSSLDPSAACKILRESAYSSDPCRMGTNRSDRVHEEKEEESPAVNVPKNNNNNNNNMNDGELFGMNNIYSHPVKNVTKWDGVALGLMLRRPRWFYKRYNVMIHNGTCLYTYLFPPPFFRESRNQFFSLSHTHTHSHKK